MAFYTDWYDYPESNNFAKLPQMIKDDVQYAKPETQRRPLPSDISLMVYHLIDMYTGNSNNKKTNDIIMETLNELGKAALKNKKYKECLLDDDVFSKYCALFLLLGQKDKVKMEFLQSLCEDLSVNLSFSDVLSEQIIILREPEIRMMEAVTRLKKSRQ